MQDNVLVDDRIHLQSTWPSRPDENHQNQKELLEHHEDMEVLYTNADSLLNKRDE
jgi:hypothetical protein